MASELYLLFLIPIVVVFVVLLVATWRILRNRRAQKQRLSVLRNVSLVVLEDAQEKERAQAREEDSSLVGRLSRMASMRSTTTRSNTIGSSYAAHSRSVSHSRKGSAPSDDATHKVPLSDIDEILISRGVLAPNGVPLAYSASRGSTKQQQQSRNVARKPVPGSGAAASKFQPGQERIELVDEPREMLEGSGGDGTQRVRIAESAKQGGHAQRNGLPRDLSVIGEAGASEASNSGFVTPAAATIALPERAASRQMSAESRGAVSPASAYSNPFGTPLSSDYGGNSPVMTRAFLDEEARPAPATGGLVRKLSDAVRLRAPKSAARPQRSATSDAAPPGDRTPNEVFEIVPQSAVQEVVAVHPASPTKATSKDAAAAASSKPRRMLSGRSARYNERRASTSNDAVRPARSPSTPPPFRPEDWSRGGMIDATTGEVLKAPVQTSLQRAASLSVPGSAAAKMDGLKRTPSIGVAGSKFKEHIDFDDDDK